MALLPGDDVPAPEALGVLALLVEELPEAVLLLEVLPVAEPLLPGVELAPLRLDGEEPLPVLAMVSMNRSLPLVPVVPVALELLDPLRLAVDPLLWSARWRHPVTVTV